MFKRVVCTTILAVFTGGFMMPFNLVSAADVSVTVTPTSMTLGATGVGMTLTFTPPVPLTTNTTIDVVYDDEAFEAVLTDSDITVTGTNIIGSAESNFMDGRFRSTLTVAGATAGVVTITIDNNPGFTNPSVAGNFAVGVIIDNGGLGITQDFGASLLYYGNANQVGVTGSVVSAVIPTCTLRVNIKPEKRIPRIGNWDTILTVEVATTSNITLRTFSFPTNTQGEGNYDLCGNGIYFPPGNYNFKIRGYSHLRKVFENILAFNTTSEFSITFLEEMLAGETSIVYDNYINMMDFVTQIQELYTADYKNDLNQDGLVNSLDFANTITNFYLNGE